MTTTKTTQELMLELAERLSYECPSTSCGPKAFTGLNPGRTLLGDIEDDCELCKGAGRIYPLRSECTIWPPSHLHSVDPIFSIFRPVCDGRGWVPVELHLETLMAALVQRGIKVSIATSEGVGESDGILWVWGTDESGLGYSKDYSYEQADPDSILNAALMASLDVVL